MRMDARRDKLKALYNDDGAARGESFTYLSESPVTHFSALFTDQERDYAVVFCTAGDDEWARNRAVDRATERILGVNLRAFLLR